MLVNLNALSSKLLDPTLDLSFVSTWYKPPNSAQDVYHHFESLVDKVDSEQKDFYLLGDLNCNMLDGSNNHNSSTLTNILDTYGLSQLISEPTRITPTSRTLIDVCVPSSPEKISSSGVIHLAISDHSLVFMTLKICYEQTDIHRTIESRVFKNFNHHHFLNDVAQQPCNRVFSETNPETMWDVWKNTDRPKTTNKTTQNQLQYTLIRPVCVIFA